MGYTENKLTEWNSICYRHYRSRATENKNEKWEEAFLNSQSEQFLLFHKRESVIFLKQNNNGLE